MPYRGINQYGLGRGRPPSRQHASPPMSSSRLAVYDMSSYQRTNIIQSPQHAISEDGTTPRAISPYPEADVSYMQSQDPYVEEPRGDYILNGPPQVQISSHAFPQNTGHSPPWNVLHTEVDYRAMTAETSDEFFQAIVDQNRYLNVPGNTRSHGTGGTRGSFSTVGTPYTAASEGYNDVAQEHAETKKGGRKQGSRLPEDSVQNIRQVRDAGACIRCRTLRMRCSDVTPCITCAELQNGRKWGRCLRSFSEMAELLKPGILAERLHFENMEGWILEHAIFPPGSELLELPLDFGFGEIFQGLYGFEYHPVSDEAQRSDAIGHGDQPRIGPGITVCPVYSSAEDAQRMIWQWLKRTLTSAQSMNQWLQRCSRVEWIRGLLQSTWEYSLTCWCERGHVQADNSKLDSNLFEAWMAALLVTMLALPVNIPEQDVHNIAQRLRFSSYNDPLPRTSRALTRAMKALFFDMYRQFVDRLTSALQDFERLKPEEVSDRRLGHIYCIAILVIVITCQIQTSLMDNVRLSSSVQDFDPNMWEVTFEHMRDVEGAFRNTIMFVKHNNVKRLKAKSILDKNLLRLRQTVQEIGRVHRDAIKGHRNVDMEGLMRSNDQFLESNMQRVFALFFDLVHKEKSQEAE